jgi:ketosteroid isomerase-like protein
MRSGREMIWITILAGLVSSVAVQSAAPNATSGHTLSADVADVHTALTRFLVAFENLDWGAFRECFDDQATVFFPSPEPGERAEGRAAYEARFRHVFDEIRRTEPSGPPFQTLEPQDLRIEVLGPNGALVTFHLRNAERLARRTVVFRKADGRWRIFHLHASNVPRQ